MDNGEDVSKPSNVFRSKVEDFLRKFKNQITDDEKEFWKERKLVTHKALSTYNKKNYESNNSCAQDVIGNRAAKSDLDAKNAPPPYDVVLFAIGTKSETDIAELKEAIDNGEEARRLADLWNLDPADAAVETMISHLTRAILRRETTDQKVTQWQVQSENANDELNETLSSLNVEKLFDDVKDYEQKCSNLPAVPEAVDPGNEEIESRLLTTKVF